MCYNGHMEQDIISLYKKNISGPDIAQKLDIQIRQVYRILDRHKIKRRNLSEQSKIRFAKIPPSFSFKENLSAKDRELLVAGTMLYYGEGAKTGTTVDLANSDPNILKLFLKFLRNICGTDEHRLRFYLYCFSNQNKVQLIKFWCRYLGISKNNFTKPYVRDTRQGNISRRMPYGVLHIRYSDKKLLHKILGLNAKFVKNL